MPFVERNEEIQALAAYGPDQPLTIGIDLGRPRRRLQHFQSEPLRQLVIDICRKDGVPVVDQEAIRSLARERFAILLQRPFRGGMRGDIKMDPPTSVMHQPQKHVQHLEADRRHGEEVDRQPSC